MIFRIVYFDIFILYLKEWCLANRDYFNSIGQVVLLVLEYNLCVAVSACIVLIIIENKGADRLTGPVNITSEPLSIFTKNLVCTFWQYLADIAAQSNCKLARV